MSPLLSLTESISLYKCSPDKVADNFELPIIYKQAIVLFRALYATLVRLPVTRLCRRLVKTKIAANLLRIACQVTPNGNPDKAARNIIPLEVPLTSGHQAPIASIDFAEIQTAAGSLKLSVQHRQHCDLRVDDSESLLSSQFMRHDEVSRIPSSQPSSM